MMSFTVICSRSKMLTNILRCRLGIMEADSVTMVRNSSWETASSPASSGEKPINLRMPLVSQLIDSTSGMSIFCSGIRTKLAGNATRSGCNAAMVLGVISAKIRITSVNTRVAMAMPASPKSRIAMTVAIAEARILTRLLPMRIRPIRRSGLCSRAMARRAPRCPVPFRCFRR